MKMWIFAIIATLLLYCNAQDRNVSNHTPVGRCETQIANCTFDVCARRFDIPSCCNISFYFSGFPDDESYHLDDEPYELPTFHVKVCNRTDFPKILNTVVICRHFLNYEESCNSSDTLPSQNITDILDGIEQNVTPSALKNINDLIKNYGTSLTISEVDAIANILNIAANQSSNTMEYKTPFFQIISGILSLNRTLLRDTRDDASTDKILKSADTFFDRLLEEPNDTEQFFSNIAFKIVHPVFSNDHYDVTFQNVSAKISKDVLNTIMITMFGNDNLFPEGNVVSDIVDLKILGVKGDLMKPVSIFLRVDPTKEVVCSFWKYGEGTNGNWSIEGVETVRINDNLVECKSNHLTAFALLGVSDRIFNRFSESHKLALAIISTILCSLSLIGLILVVITCFTLKGWYKKRLNTVQLTFIITFEICLLFLDNFVTIDDGPVCILFGVLLHYLVLAKFTLMLFIAKKQYDNFVSVLTSRNKSGSHILNALISFSVPILIVAISVGVFSENYNSGNVEFCYPKDEAFKYFLILPVALILLCNLIVFSMVMFKISLSISRDSKQKVLQAKLALMLFFMLGLTWLFSVFSHVVYTQWLQLLFVYVFCILSPLQGFIIFLFAVVVDGDAKAFWMHCYNRVRYAQLERESSNTKTTIVLMSNVAEAD